MNLDNAIEDFKYLINRGYRKDVALNFVANHYKLKKKERMKLIRCIHTNDEIKNTKQKIKRLHDINGKEIYIDGFNVLIGLEALLKEHEIIKCDDGIYRDFEEIYGKYKINEYTEKAVDLLLKIIKQYNLKPVIYLDSQVSKSGILAKKIRKKMNLLKMDGNVFCVKNCDYMLKSKDIVVTSDSIIIKSTNVKYVVDLIYEGIIFIKSSSILQE